MDTVTFHAPSDWRLKILISDVYIEWLNALTQRAAWYARP
jgi:hypothetical protein